MDTQQARGRGRGGRRRGGGRGRGSDERRSDRGHGDAHGHARYAKDSCFYVFLGGENRRLLPYKGPLEDARLGEFDVFQLCPEVPTENQSLKSRPLLNPEMQSKLREALQPGMYWKTQFGTQLVYFGHPLGLPKDLEESLTVGAVKESRFKETFDRPKCSSFVSLTFSDIDSVVGFLREKYTVVEEEVIYNLRVTEKKEYGGLQLNYERSAKSREDVLEEGVFPVDAFKDETRCANVVFSPPTVDGQDYLLFRLQAIQPREPASGGQRLQITCAEGRPSVKFLGTAGFPAYTRVEERHVLKIYGSEAEIHVVKVEEYGSTVGCKANPVRVESRCVSPDADEENRRQAMEAFVQHSVSLCRRLARFRTRKAQPVNAGSVTPQLFCPGDSAAAPCPADFCNFKHQFTMCFSDASNSCTRGNDCNYWHGVSEVRELLQSLGSEPLASADFTAMRVGKTHFPRFRVALSMHLQRLRGVAWTGSKSAEEKAELKEELAKLVQQYNTVARSFHKEVATDILFYNRCTCWLKNPLPLLAARDEIRDACLKRKGTNYMLITSSTGSGKSTQLPQYLAECAMEKLNLGRASRKATNKQKIVICVEPRPLAARSLADHVSREYDGPDVRLRNRVCFLGDCQETPGTNCHIAYTTSHVFLSVIRSGRLNLSTDVYAVVLDEAHERSVAGDMLLGILKAEMRRTNCAFRLVVCSATLQVNTFADYLPGARHISVKSRLHPIEVVYAGRHDCMRPEADYVQETVDAVISIIEDPPTVLGSDRAVCRIERHILAFLPAATDVEVARDILDRHIARQNEGTRTPERASSEARSEWEGVRLYTLSDQQPLEEQQRVFENAKPPARKVIFATPVAKTSITIDGVGYVVDSGLMQVSRYDPVRHFAELAVSPITQSSAVQRAGRAGRTGPGVCIRLYTQTSFNLLERDNAPAVRTAPLHVATLQLAERGCSMHTFDWIDRPVAAVIEAIHYDLMLLDALENAERAPEAVAEDMPPTLKDFGTFLLGLGEISLALGRLLYEAKTSGSNELLALAALTVATIERFDDLFSVPRGEEEACYAKLREYGGQYNASSRGDVLCAVQVVAAALVEQRGVGDVAGEVVGTHSNVLFRHHVVEDIAKRQRTYFASAITAGGRSGVGGRETPIPAVSPALVETHAEDLQKWLAMCFCTQVAIRRSDESKRYEAAYDSDCVCVMSNYSFVKQHNALESNGEGGAARQRYSARDFPEVCVFGSLLFYSPTKPCVISLCTPVEVEWLPDVIQKEVKRLQGKKPVVRRIALPSVLLNVWRPREVTRWLSHKLNTTLCKVEINYTVKQLALSGDEDVVEAAYEALSRAIEHARASHEQTCCEVALNGFCRVTWKRGCEKGEVLRDQDEYVSLLFSGACKPSINCLELDLPEMVEVWSRRWFGRPMVVAVRSGSGGASPASGRWTALVTFVNSKDASDFFKAFGKADEAARPFVTMEPYCEQETLAPAHDATVPLCRIHLRLYFGHADPESGIASVGAVSDVTIARVMEFQRVVREALPSGVLVQSQQLDQGQQLLHMQLLAVNERAADAALAILHGIRGPSVHYRSLFLDVAYSAELPLPAVTNRALQRLLQEIVSRHLSEGEPVQQTDAFSCEPLFTHGHRSLLLKCATPAVLQRARRFLDDYLVERHIRLSGHLNSVERINKARALSLRPKLFIDRFNAWHRGPEDSINECQLRLRDADGALCFMGRESTFKKVQDFINHSKCVCDVECTTLMLPAQSSSASKCNAFLSELVASCRLGHLYVRCIREYNTIILIAPQDIIVEAKGNRRVSSLWQAIDGEKNALYDPNVGDVTAGGNEAADERNAPKEDCAICFCELQMKSFRLLCGHQFCTECLAGAFNADGGAAPEPPIKCVCCAAPIAADELALYAPRVGQKRLGEFLRSRLVAEAGNGVVETKECPNKVCLGVPKVVSYANRKCSGCDLAYCEVCMGNGAVRPWHEGKHLSPADILADRLVEQLPLLPKCPQCSRPFYDFDGCFAVSCGRVHGFCGFCMADCGRDAHAHVRKCARNPKRGGYHGRIDVFYRCRAEDLAAKMKDVLLGHPAGSAQLVTALCDKVRSLMSDDWPKDPIAVVEAELLHHRWGAQATATSTAPDDSLLVQDNATDVNDRSDEDEDTPADNAEHILAELENFPTTGKLLCLDEEVDVAHLMSTTWLLKDYCGIDLSSAVNQAVRPPKTVLEAVALLYSFFDEGRRLEEELRASGVECPLRKAEYSFLQILLRGLQLSHEKKPMVVQRKVILTAKQMALYTRGGVIAWEAPTCCEEVLGGEGERREGDEVIFLIQCSAYSSVSSPDGKSVARYVLPARARLRITKMEEGVIHLQQECDHVFKAWPGKEPT